MRRLGTRISGLSCVGTKTPSALLGSAIERLRVASQWQSAWVGDLAPRLATQARLARNMHPAHVEPRQVASRRCTSSRWLQRCLTLPIPTPATSFSVHAISTSSVFYHHLLSVSIVVRSCPRMHEKGMRHAKVARPAVGMPRAAAMADTAVDERRWRRKRAVVLVRERVGVWGSRTHTVSCGRPRGVWDLAPNPGRKPNGHSLPVVAAANMNTSIN